MPQPRVLFNKNFSVTAAQIRALDGSGYEVWASHSDPHQGMMAAAPHTLTEPKGLLGDEYIGWLLEACREHQFDFLIPGKERERLALHHAEFEAVGTRVLSVASEETQRHLERKDEFLEGWDSRILPIPEWTTFHNLAQFETGYAALKRNGVRLCVKPARGIYASGFRIILEQPDLRAFLKGELYHLTLAGARELFGGGDLPTMLLMHTLEGHERSIDCVAWQGRLIRAVVRRKGGAGQVIEDRPDLVAAAQKITEKYALSGIFNFQTKDQNGMAHMLEINARASGGLRYSMAAGVNFAGLLLDAASGRLDWDALPPVQVGLRVAEDKTVRTWRQ